MLQPVTLILSCVEISIFSSDYMFCLRFCDSSCLSCVLHAQPCMENLPHNKFGKYMYLIDIVSDA